MPIFNSGYNEKTSPNNDNDAFLIADSADSNVVKYSKWSTMKSAIRTYISGLTDWVTTAAIADGAVTPSKIDSPVDYSLKDHTNTTGNYTTTSTSLVSIDATNVITTLNVRSGKLVRVDVSLSGISNNNTSYGINIDVGLDGTTSKSTSGPILISPAGYGANWASGGASRVTWHGVFFFKSVSSGSHTFRILWSTESATVTASLSQYARQNITVTELA